MPIKQKISNFISRVQKMSKTTKQQGKPVDEKVLLSVQNLSVSYGPIQALKNVSLEVHKGSIVAILGANGAGKTTLLKKISGLVAAKEGVIIFDGDVITTMAAERITNKGIVQSPEGRQIFGDLTVYENLMIGAFTAKAKAVKVKNIYPNARNQRVNALIASAADEEVEILLTKKEIIQNNLERVYQSFPVLKERRDQVALSLSGGEQQMLAIGRALMAMPKLLILDEPSLGLAPLIVRDIFRIVKELNQQDTTVLIVEQNALQTLKIADYAYVIQVGKVIKEGDADKLINDQELIDAYLGK